MCFSGFSGTEQPRGGVSGAGAAAGGACDGRGGDDRSSRTTDAGVETVKTSLPMILCCHVGEGS